MRPGNQVEESKTLLETLETLKNDELLTTQTFHAKYRLIKAQAGPYNHLFNKCKRYCKNHSSFEEPALYSWVLAISDGV